MFYTPKHRTAHRQKANAALAGFTPTAKCLLPMGETPPRSTQLPEHTPVLPFLEVDPDWEPEHAIRSANAWRQLASTHDWKAFLDEVNFEGKDPKGTVECEYWFEQKGAHEPGQRYVIVHVHYSGFWHDF